MTKLVCLLLDFRVHHPTHVVGGVSLGLFEFPWPHPLYPIQLSYDRRCLHVRSQFGAAELKADHVQQSLPRHGEVILDPLLQSHRQALLCAAVYDVQLSTSTNVAFDIRDTERRRWDPTELGRR